MSLTSKTICNFNQNSAMQSILTHQQIEQKIMRLAHQIIENSFGESTIFLGGICGNGLVLAEKLKTIIEAEGRTEIILFEIIALYPDLFKDLQRFNANSSKIFRWYSLGVKSTTAIFM